MSTLPGYKYDPYGRTLSSSGTLAAANTYRFSSKEIHPSSGLYYYGYRFYDSNTQRWLNRDPIEEAGGVNLYRFVGNAPLGNVDTEGESIFSIPTGGQNAPPVMPPATIFQPLPGPAPAVVQDTLSPGGVRYPGSYNALVNPAFWGTEMGETINDFNSAVITPLLPFPFGSIRCRAAAKTPALPDRYWINKKAPTQVDPGTRRITDMKPSGRSQGEVYERTSHYDQFGRQSGQTHKTAHGEPAVHPNPHHHTRNPVTGEVSDPLPGVHPDS